MRPLGRDRSGRRSTCPGPFAHELLAGLDMTRYRLFPVRLGSISRRPFGGETAMKIEREDHGSGNNIVRRHRSRDGYLAVEEAPIPNTEPMLATGGAQSSTPTSRLEGSTAHCLRSRRHDGPAAYRAG